MSKCYKVKVIENKEERVYDRFSNPWMAVGFAQGYAQCLAESGTRMETPCVPSLDGYQWWAKDEEIQIYVLDSDNELFDGQ